MTDSMNKPRLNPEMLEFYRGIPGDNGKPLLDEVVKVFADDLPMLLGKIESARERGDHKELRSAAHQLKGSAGNFGADDLVQMALDIEALADKSEEVSRERVQALETEAGLLLEELQGCL